MVGGEHTGAGTRGYFGVGAKDCAVLGHLTVETVDASGSLSRVSIPRSYRKAEIHGPSKATNQDYQRLFGRRKRAGTIARIELAKKSDGGPTLPLFRNLADQLSKHFALRNLLDRNDVQLVDRTHVTESKSPSRRLRYGDPIWTGSQAKQQFEGTLSIEGYPEAQPHLKLFDVGEETRGRERSDQFEGFVLVRSPAADHGFFLPGFESHPYATRLAGELMDPYIQVLLDEFREIGPTGGNDRPIVRQDRNHQDGGLDPNHAYYRRLVEAIQPRIGAALETITKELQEAERAGITPELQRANLEAGAWLGSFLEEDSSVGPPQLPDGFYFLPSSVRVGPETSKRLTLYNVGSQQLLDGELTVASDDDDLVSVEELADFSEPQLPKSGGSPRQRASIVVRAGLSLGSATLTARYEKPGNEPQEVQATAKVVADPPPASEFHIEHSSYTIRPSSQKAIRVVVPWDLVGQNILDPVQLRVESEDESIVAIGATVTAVAAGAEDYVREANILEFRIEARGGASASARLYARFREHEASATVRASGNSITVFDDDNDASPPDSRAVVYESGQCPGPPEHNGGPCLHVFFKHPDVEKWLGKILETPSGDVTWEHLNTPGFRAMRADAIAEAAAQNRVLRLNSVRQARTGEPVSADEVLRLFWREKRRALPQMQRIFIEGGPVSWASQSHAN